MNAAVTNQISDSDRRPMCLCHDAIDCPDEATVEVNVRDLALLGELLADVDEFLRSGDGVVEVLADFYARRRGDAHPRFTAINLIDAVCFTAALPHRLLAQRTDGGGDR